ncbi:MAG: PQQ-binding-like beta-propeller repeat protein [Acidimicrobiales bacterium]
MTGVLGSGAVLPSGEVALTVTDAFDPADAARSAIVALDPRTGAVRHRVQLPGIVAEGFVDLVPVGRDLVVLDAGRRRLVRVDPLRGRAPVWTAELPASRLGGAARLGDGRIWLALVDGQVVALDAQTGDVAVQTSELGLDLSSVGLAQAPVEAGGTVVVTGGLLALGVPAGGS